MDLVLLTETIIKKIVTDPESVSVKEFQTDEENEIQIEVLISSDDMGKVIGKNGKIIISKKHVRHKSTTPRIFQHFFVYFDYGIFNYICVKTEKYRRREILCGG